MLHKDDADSASESAAQSFQDAEPRHTIASSNISGYISENYTMLMPPSESNGGSSKIATSPHKRPARCSLPVIAESSSLILAAPATSPDCTLDTSFCSLHLPGGMGSSGPKTSNSELAGLVLQLREERRGNSLMVQRIRDLERVVREQENIIKQTASEIPFEWRKNTLETDLSEYESTSVVLSSPPGPRSHSELHSSAPMLDKNGLSGGVFLNLRLQVLLYLCPHTAMYVSSYSYAPDPR
jgi:hypothetical protein